MVRMSIIAATLALAACSSPERSGERTAPAAPGSTASAGPAPAPAEAEAAAGMSHADDAVAVSTLDETEARLLLAEMFRDAGYRILYDVEVVADGQLLAVDGYDPEKRVGYEYIAAPERATAASATSVTQKSDAHVLVIGPTSREELRERARRFIEERAAKAQE